MALRTLGRTGDISEILPVSTFLFAGLLDDAVSTSSVIVPNKPSGCYER
jgi:hypothetical protein